MDLLILVNAAIKKNGGQENNMEKKLIQLFTEFTLTDLLGFGKLVGVNDTKMEFEDFITEIVVEFSKRRRKERRSLLKLAQKIVEDNRTFKYEDEKKNNNNDDD